MTKSDVKKQAFNFLSKFGSDIKTKFGNICGKTGQYNVPPELFQKRTSRKNRVLISWKTVKRNNLSIERLSTFYGGVVVEFINEDFFDESNFSNPLFVELKNRLGSNKQVSSIISIRSETGSSSSQVQRDNFNKLINNTKVQYNGKEVVINKSNYEDYAIKRIGDGGIGNETWEGFLFVSIRGGQQDTIETHRGKEELLFNPACEYANEKVCLDIDLVVSYFALMSVDKAKLSMSDQIQYDLVLSELKHVLKETKYKYQGFDDNLLSYCDNHPSLKLQPGKLYDPIQVEQINIEDFGIKDKEDPRNLDFTHDEAVNLDLFYWDEINKCVLSPARPTNIFWSKHLSNMMQQNFSLSEYFEEEEKRIKKRREMLSNK